MDDCPRIAHHKIEGAKVVGDEVGKDTPKCGGPVEDGERIEGKVSVDAVDGRKELEEKDGEKDALDDKEEAGAADQVGYVPQDPFDVRCDLEVRWPFLSRR